MRTPLETFLAREPEATTELEYAILDFDHAPVDGETGGRQAAHVETDFQPAGAEKRHGAEDLEHALKDTKHTPADSKHARQDLKHLHEELATVIAWAAKAGMIVTLAEVKAHVAAAAKHRRAGRRPCTRVQETPSEETRN
jgi:hypothetical protein